MDPPQAQGQGPAPRPRRLPGSGAANGTHVCCTVPVKAAQLPAQCPQPSGHTAHCGHRWDGGESKGRCGQRKPIGSARECRMAAPPAESGSRFEVRWTGNAGAAQVSRAARVFGVRGAGRREHGCQTHGGRVPVAMPSGGRAGRTASVRTSHLVLQEVRESRWWGAETSRRPATQRCVRAAVWWCLMERCCPRPCPRGTARKLFLASADIYCISVNC